MAKPSQNAALDRTARLLDLVPYLATHQGISLQELATEFGISQSQLTEDLTTLWMCGLPGYTALELMDLSFDTGFVTISNAETLARPRILNRDEVLALVLGLEALLEETETIGNDLSPTISRLIRKLAGFMGSKFEQQIQAGTSVSSNVRAVIEKAIETRTPVGISYHSISHDEFSYRVIHPLEFSLSMETEYVFAFCESSKGYRTFRVDRISEATLSSESGEIALESIPTANEEKFPLTIEIASRLRDVAERFNLDPAQSEFNGIIQIESFSADWAVREIMSFGGEVHLHTPRSLRKLIRERSERALIGYHA